MSSLVAIRLNYQKQEDVAKTQYNCFNIEIIGNFAYCLRPLIIIMKNNITDNIRMAAPDAIIVISKDRKIIAFNDAAERITGYKFRDIINTDFHYVLESRKFKYFTSCSQSRILFCSHQAMALLFFC